MAADWPLVGRQEELQFVSRSMGAVDSSGVLIAGSAGVGKTRLARTALAEIRPKADCEWVVATETLRSIPFGALAHLIPSPGPGDRRIRVVRSDSFDLLRTAIADIRRRNDARRVVIGVDDAHLLDGESAALLHQVAVMQYVKLILTTRSGEPAPDALVALWKDGVVERLEIQPLSRLEVDELVTGVLGGQVERRSLQRLAEASGGNALLLRELVEAAFADGTLEASDGVWVWRGEVRASPRLRDLIEARMAQLGGAERTVVETLAVGEPLPVGILEGTLPEGDLGDLERRGFIRVEADQGHEPTARLAHPLQAEVLRAALPISARRAIQRRLADAVKGTPTAGPEDALRRALWVVDSGAALDSEVLLAAAEVAIDRMNFAIAERLARAALAPVDQHPELRFHAALCLADSLNGQGHYEEAEATVSPLATPATNDLDRTRVALTRRVSLFLGMAKTDEAREMLRATAASLSDTNLAARLAAEEAVVAAYSGRLREASILGEAVLARPGLDRLVRWRALSAAGPAWAYSGRTGEALTATEAALTEVLPIASDIPEVVAWLGTVRLTTLLLAGRLDEAAALLDAAEMFQPVGPYIRSSAWLALARGKLELLVGRPATAARWMRDAIPSLRESDPGHLLPWCRSVLAEACALCGEPVTAAEVLAEAQQAPLWGMSEGDVRRAACWVAAGLGELSRARQQAIHAADWCHADGQLGLELHALHDAVRLDALSEAAPRLLEVAHAVDGDWPPAYMAHTHAKLARDADGLLEAADSFEAMRGELLAAEAAAEAAALLGPDRPRGRQAAAQANRLASACEGAMTPALSSLGPSARLTRREQEIARLAAAGLSNREIADRLVVSVRTVEGHLLRTYVKLGVQTREDLTAVLAGPS